MSEVRLQQELEALIKRRNWLLLVALVAASAIAWDLKFTLGVVAGGLLAIANFSLLSRVLVRQFEPGHKPSISGVLVRYYLRFIATAVVILLLIKFSLVGPIGLLIGLSVIVFNLAAIGIRLFRQAKLTEAH